MASMTLIIEEDTSKSTIQKIASLENKKEKHGHHFASHAEETKAQEDEEEKDRKYRENLTEFKRG
jgi:hypothetical protein